MLLTDPGESGVRVETTEGGERSILSYPEFVELRAHNTVLSGLFAAQSAVSDLDVYTGRTGQENSALSARATESGTSGNRHLGN